MTEYTVFYFSATGNTEKCAKEIMAHLENAGRETTLFRIENGKEQPPECDKIIIGYPVHGFGAPENVLRFAKSLPDGRSTAYIFKTSGEPLRINDNSSSALIKILEKKGYDVRGEYHYIMPYNMIFRHTDDMATKMLLTAKERIKKDVKDVIEGKKHTKKILLRAKIAYGVSVIEHPGVRFNGRLFRVDMKKCSQCGLCVKRCPTNNISFKDKKFRFGGDCILCSRCAFFCPKDAVRIGLMDFMRVNGKYDFNADPEKAEIGKYCHKAYERYFSGE